MGAETVAAIAGVTFFLQFFFAIGVFTDGLELLRKKRHVYFLWPAGWALFTLITGIVGASAYWIMHHSTLCREA